MAGGTPDSFVHVDFVIEVNEVGQIVDLDPGYGFTRCPAGPHRLQQGCVGPDLRVAIHAGLGGGDARVAGLLHRGVTVLALQSQAHDVMLMAERHRLFCALSLLGHPRRTLQLIEGDSQGDDNQPCQDQARAG